MGHIYRDTQEVDVGDAVPGRGRGHFIRKWLAMPTLLGYEQG